MILRPAVTKRLQRSFVLDIAVKSVSARGANRRNPDPQTAARFWPPVVMVEVNSLLTRISICSFSITGRTQPDEAGARQSSATVVGFRTEGRP